MTQVFDEWANHEWERRRWIGLTTVWIQTLVDLFRSVGPDLVYTELICIIAVSALLIFWAIALKAPLEEAASIAKTPVSSKAPWYFLGLQDMLVYYDPWMASVVLPGAIVCGLIAIPYLDFNKAGNGYYTIHQRRFSYIVFQYGFLLTAA